MREIKFRGKDAKTKEWVYGVPYTKEIFSTEHKKIIGYKTYIITYLADDLRSIEREEVDPNTVGQYTGLHDKNGKEIYEGDIVKTRLQDEYVVLFSTEDVGSCGCCYASFSGSGFVGELEDENGYSKRCDLSLPEYIEVIGNVHDNKLEKENE